MIRRRRSSRPLAVLGLALVVLATSLSPLPVIANELPLSAAGSAADATPEPAAADATPEPAPAATPEPAAGPGGDPTPAPLPTPVPSLPADATPVPEDPGPGPEGTSAPDPAPAAAPATSSLLVTFASKAAYARRDEPLAAQGATETRALPALRLSTIDVPADRAADIRQALRGEPGILAVEPDRLRSVDATPGDLRIDEQWALPVIGWPEVHDGPAPADRAVVAILDTGVDGTHPDLEGRLLPGAAFVDGALPDRDPNGHGTAMAGIVAAATDNGTGIAGVGFAGVAILPVTVIDAEGNGRDSDIVSGVVYAVDHGADVVLMAFSSRSDSKALRAAIEYAWTEGAVVVAAVGNDDSDALTYPAGDPDVVGVAATGRDDLPWPTGNRGPAVAMAAPGSDILTTAPGGAYQAVSGTSAAAAHVAGAAALLKARDPSLANDAVVGRLLRTAAPVGSTEQTGAGRLDLAAAWADTSTDGFEPGGGDPGAGTPNDPYRVAATCSSRNGGGNWNQAATWTCGRVPGSTAATDTAVITAGNPVSVTANTGTNNTTAVTIDAGATLTVNAGRTLAIRSAPATVTVDGTLTITGTLTASGLLAVNGTLVHTGTLNATGTIAVNSGATYRFNRNGGTVPTATWDPASTLLVTGWTTATGNPPAGFGQAFGNLTWNSTGQTQALSFAGTLTTIRGSLTVQSTGTGSLAAGGTGPGDTTIDGNLVVSGGILRGNFEQAAGATRTITAGGSVSLTGGTLDLNGANDGAVTLDVAGDFSVTGGTLAKTGTAAANVVFIGTTNQTYTSGATVSGAVAFTVASGASLQMASETTVVAGSGTFTLAAGSSLGIRSTTGITTSGATGNVQVTGTRSFSTAADYTYNGTGAGVPGNGLPSTVGNLTVAKPSGALALAASVTVGGDLSITGGTLDLGTFTANRGSAGGTLTVANGTTLRIGGTGTLPADYATHAVGATSTVDHYGTGAVGALSSGQSYGNLVISGNVSAGTAGFAVTTSLAVGAGATWTPAGGTVTMNHGSTILNSGTLTFRGLTIPAVATVTSAASFGVAGPLVVAAGATFAPSAGTVTMTGTAWSIANAGTLTFRGLTIAGTAATPPSSSYGVAGPLTVGAATTLAPAGGTITLAGTGWTIANNGTLTFAGLTVAGTPATAPTATFGVGGVLGLNAPTIFAPTAGTITLTDGASIANSGTLAFQNLSIAAGAAVTGAGDFTVEGTFTTNTGGSYTPAAAQVIGGTGTLTGAGTVRVTRTAATAGFVNQYTIASRTLTNLTVEYAGSAAQVVSALAYGGLRIDNASGVTLAGTTTVGGTLTLSAGTITTGASNLSIAAGGSVSRSSGHVVGNLRKAVLTGAPTVTFEVGDAGAYTPVTVAFASVTTAGDLTASASAGDHPAIGGGPIDGARDANRSWSLAASGLAFTRAGATFTFVPADLDTGADTSRFRVARHVSGTWSATAAGTRTATSSEATGLVAFGEFATGEPRGPGIFTDDADIGGPAMAGFGYESGGTYTVQGAGTDIWNTADQFHFLYRSLTGDGAITARVTAVGNSDPWAKAGVMIRDTSAGDSRHALVAMTPGNGVAFQWRPTTGGTSGNVNLTGVAAPYWVRLVRTGDTFTAYRSPDNATWTQLGAAQVIPMGATVQVGLAVTSHNAAALSTATFEAVSIHTPPAAAADTYSITQDNTLVVAASGVLANDTAASGTLTVGAPRPVAGPANGTLTLDADGSFSYAPDPGFTGSDSFTYRAVDGLGVASSPATVTIDVTSSAYISDEGWGTAFDPARHLDLTFPAYAPAGSIIASATFRHTYRSAGAGTTCWYLEVRDGPTLIGSHGSAASPISCATGTFVTDDIALPEISDAARANAVTVRLYLRNSAGGRSEHRLATLDLGYSLP